MSETTVTIMSGGLRLAGTLRVPEGVARGERRAAFMVLHGFGSSRSSSNVLAPSRMLNELGYATLAFDMRGCGESEGEHGRVICLEQVEDTRNALTFLASQTAVDPARTGKSLMVPRYDIVPIPPHLRSNLVSNSIQEFPAETAQSMFDFRADDVVGRIAPRPLLLLHAANDSVTPTEQSIELFKRAGQPCELHLISDADHFMFAEKNARVWDLLRAWLMEYFPAVAAATKAAAGMGH